jgi:hypothetical protein
MANTQINITENGTTTLDTAGKYCDRNIDVNVNVNVEELLIARITNTLVEYSSDSLSMIADSAFNDCTALESVNLPKLTTAGGYAFANTGLVNIDLPSFSDGKAGYTFYKCTNLKTARLPAMEHAWWIGHMFDGCTSLESVEMEKLEAVEPAMFIGCKSLKSLNIPMVTLIGIDGFKNCTALEIANFPMVESIGREAFANCASLVEANFSLATSAICQNGYGGVFDYCTSLKAITMPKLESIGFRCFRDCTALESVNFPCVTTVGVEAFTGCSALKIADFSIEITMNAYAFVGATKFSTLILRSDSVCPIKNVNVFERTPFASGGTGGVVYVPQALIGSYRAATNWSTLYAAGTCDFVAIEGSEYE